MLFYVFIVGSHLDGYDGEGLELDDYYSSSEKHGNLMRSVSYVDSQELFLKIWIAQSGPSLFWPSKVFILISTINNVYITNIVRWRHTLKIDASIFLVFFSTPTATVPMQWERVISFSSALTSPKRFGRKENWLQLDLNPQHSEFIGTVYSWWNPGLLRVYVR